MLPGPKRWQGVCQSGKRQSPIDITGATQDKDLGAFTLTNYDSTPINDSFIVLNNGHGLKVNFPDKVYNVTGGGLPGEYTTAQLHIHWGEVDGRGSEHTVDKKKYAAEARVNSFSLFFLLFFSQMSFFTELPKYNRRCQHCYM